MSIEEEIRRIEEEIRRTQYNKATEHHIGRLKAKLARLKQELQKRKKVGGRVEGIKKSGDASVAITGPPFTGKSTLVKVLTGVEEEASSYKPPKAVPAMLKYKGAEIQLIDLPGITKNSLRGKLREVYQVLRWVDLIVVVVDPYTQDMEKEVLNEIREIGVRPGENEPDIYLEEKSSGGIVIRSTVEQELEEATIRKILREFGVINGEIILREKVTIDRLIDFLAGNRVYVPYITIMNKADEGGDHNFKISALQGINIEEFKEKLFRELNLIRVFLKPPGKEADMENPMILRAGNTVEDLCKRLHRNFIKNFRYAQVWGKSVKFPGQRVGLSHTLQDGDIVSIVVRR